MTASTAPCWTLAPALEANPSTDQAGDPDLALHERAPMFRMMVLMFFRLGPVVGPVG
ncbi:hypothetical protein ACFY0A_37695 [Streptomyces sp. NPDC001698]|uniref:hypothetical protein n=1 Tax=Streptomyces sp. NPDC001698 TaxID=3364601 RepID=UPI0036BFA97E